MSQEQLPVLTYTAVSHTCLPFACAHRNCVSCVLVFQPHEDISSYQLKFCAISHLLQFTAEEPTVRNQMNQLSHSAPTGAKHCVSED